MGKCTKKSLSKYNFKTLQNQKNINKFTTYIMILIYKKTKKKILLNEKIILLSINMKILRETFFIGNYILNIIYKTYNNEVKKNLCGF